MKTLYVELNYGLEITGTCEKDSEINGISISQEADEQQLDILIAGKAKMFSEGYFSAVT